PQWLQDLACFSRATSGEYSPEQPEIDPTHSWFALHGNISKFLEGVPQDQQLRVRGEEILLSPDSALCSIIEWVGLEASEHAIEGMKHPERSPYAGFGPPSARYGDDAFFLANPALSPSPASAVTLEGPVTWREDGAELSEGTKQLARSFGYE